jgi:hypothetical protein
MDALASMEIGKRPGNIRGERDPEAPGERFGLVVNVISQITIVDELGYDENAIIWFRGAREAHVGDDVGMPAFLHQAPFSFKVFGYVVFVGRQYFLDGDINTQVFA